MTNIATLAHTVPWFPWFHEQQVWISEVYLKKQIHALRACITSFRTQEEDIVFLVETLNKTKTKIEKQRGKGADKK